MEGNWERTKIFSPGERPLSNLNTNMRDRGNRHRQWLKKKINLNHICSIKLQTFKFMDMNIYT